MRCIKPQGQCSKCFAYWTQIVMVRAHNEDQEARALTAVVIRDVGL